LAYESDGRVVPEVEHFTPLIHKPRSILTTRPTIWRRIYRKSFLRDHKITFPTHIRRFDDLPFQFHALAMAKTVASIPAPHYFYRQERPGQDIGIRDDRLYVHFDIFQWLDEQLNDVMERNMEKPLLQVELNTHAWALSIIDEKHRSEYLRQAARQLFRPRHHLRWYQVAQRCWKAPPSIRPQARQLLKTWLFHR